MKHAMIKYWSTAKFEPEGRSGVVRICIISWCVSVLESMREGRKLLDRVIRFWYVVRVYGWDCHQVWCPEGTCFGQCVLEG